MALPAVIATGAAAYTTGKSFLAEAKSIFSRGITPKGGIGLLYKYVDNPIGWFAADTGQHFGRTTAALVYLRTKGKVTTNPTDYVVFLPESKRFSGYSLYGGHLWDRNVVPFGEYVTDATRGALRDKVYTERPATSIPSDPRIGSPKTGSVISDDTVPAKQAQGSGIIPVIGLIGLLVSASK